ncbi:hypothetical protein ACFWOL_24210, partial [Streptomyces sp. NPDC058442]
AGSGAAARTGRRVLAAGTGRLPGPSVRRARSNPGKGPTSVVGHAAGPSMPGSGPPAGSLTRARPYGLPGDGDGDGNGGGRPAPAVPRGPSRAVSCRTAGT